MIRFGQELCRNVQAACRREWLDSNGIGGFASFGEVSSRDGLPRV